MQPPSSRCTVAKQSPCRASTELLAPLFSASGSYSLLRSFDLRVWHAFRPEAWPLVVKRCDAFLKLAWSFSCYGAPPSQDRPSQKTSELSDSELRPRPAPNVGELSDMDKQLWTVLRKASCGSLFASWKDRGVTLALLRNLAYGDFKVCLDVDVVQAHAIKEALQHFDTPLTHAAGSAKELGAEHRPSDTSAASGADAHVATGMPAAAMLSQPASSLSPKPVAQMQLEGVSDTAAAAPATTAGDAAMQETQAGALDVPPGCTLRLYPRNDTDGKLRWQARLPKDAHPFEGQRSKEQSFGEDDKGNVARDVCLHYLQRWWASQTLTDAP